MKIVEIEEQKLALAFLGMLRICLAVKAAGGIDPDLDRVILDGKAAFEKIAKCSAEGFRLVLVKGENYEPSQN